MRRHESDVAEVRLQRHMQKEEDAKWVQVRLNQPHRVELECFTAWEKIRVFFRLPGKSSVAIGDLCFRSTLGPLRVPAKFSAELWLKGTSLANNKYEVEMEYRGTLPPRAPPGSPRAVRGVKPRDWIKWDDASPTLSVASVEKEEFKDEQKAPTTPKEMLIKRLEKSEQQLYLWMEEMRQMRQCISECLETERLN